MTRMIERFTLDELADMAEFDARINAEFNRKVNASHRQKKSPSVLEHGQANGK